MDALRRHEETWLLLPWLANGRLPPGQRAEVEDHVRECARCAQEVRAQQLLCAALAEPDRVTYAPGPSFRKLMGRIEGRSAQAHTVSSAPPLVRSRTVTWRPPGLAWAASLVLVAGLSALAATAYRWSQPLYVTHTAAPAPDLQVLHVAFVPTLPVSQAGELLQTAGARIVTGPDTAGTVGITPIAGAGNPDAAAALSALAARLRADPRVRWVEPRDFSHTERLTPQP
jgi:hypothetical protein